MKKYLPVLLLTGYLGSGKTTLLNRILNNRRGIRFAVIVNDIGEVNIDADLIQRGGIVGNNGEDDLVALQNGCICCTLKTDLLKQLAELCAADKFDYIVIEASGICEPEPIAQTICSMPAIVGPEYKGTLPVVDCIATVVDALRMEKEFECGDALGKKNLDEEDIENLIIQQIEFCNVIVLNKISEVSKESAEHIKAIIRALQPKAKIIECDYGDFNLEEILHTGMFDFDQVAMSATWIQEIEKEVEEEEHEHHHEHHHEHEGEEHEHDHDHDHHHHHDEGEAEEYGIGTFVYFRRRPFDLNKFDFFLSRYPKTVIRTKGLVYFSDNRDMSYLFEQAGTQMNMREAGYWFATAPQNEIDRMLSQDEKLRKEWDPVYGDRMIKLVFIGKDMDRERIVSELDDCLA